MPALSASFLLCAALAPSAAAPVLILSEAMADPAALPDAHGEFLELGNTGADSLILDSARVEAEGQAFVARRLRLAPGGAWLICRDTSAANGGMRCDAHWPGLSLANGRALRIGLSAAGWARDYDVPASRSGVSWENAWDPGADFGSFLASRGRGPGGDSATPGGRNSRSLRAPLRNLAVAAADWSPGTVKVRVEERGAGASDPAWISIRLDADWDGEAETRIDSVPARPGSEAEVRMDQGLRGELRIALAHGAAGRDEDRADDVAYAAAEDVAPLVFSEWHPAPADGGSEWVEIRNRTGEGGRAPRGVDLARVTLNGWSLGPRAGILGPGEYAVLAGSAAAFRSRFGPVRARVLQPAGWTPLRNTGDTLALALGGWAADTLAYGPVASGEDGPATPGYADAPAAAAGWDLAGRVASRASPLSVSVRAPQGSRYALRAFDLEGNRVRDLGGGGAGTRAHAWDGRGDGGRALPRGPYVLCLAFAGGRTFKRAVLAGER